MRHVSVAALISALAVVLVAAPATGQDADAGWTPSRTAWGHPDLQGIWDQTTGTPLERAAEVADREFLTGEEAAERERVRFAAFDAAPRQGSPGNYGSEWRDGSRNALTRTSFSSGARMIGAGKPSTSCCTLIETVLRRTGRK